MTTATQKGLSRLIKQYQSSPKFKGYLEAILDEVVTVSEALDQILAIADMDYAAENGFDDALDIHGEFVGQSRILPEAIPLEFFGFYGREGSLPMGDINIPGRGGRFFDIDRDSSANTSTVLDNMKYLAAIKFRAVRNRSHGYQDDYYAALQFIIPQVDGSPSMIVSSSGGMKVRISIGRHLTSIEKAMMSTLNFLPVSAGVKVTVEEFKDGDYFGFLGQPGAKGFGEVDDPSVGGSFAEKVR